MEKRVTAMERGVYAASIAAMLGRSRAFSQVTIEAA
jgi:hypothetical protein